jgi:hypothetical protein
MERGERRGGDIWFGMYWIIIGFVGLTYFMAKCGRLRCVGLDIVEGLLKLLMFITNLFRGLRRS